MVTRSTLSHEQARAFYDRFGAKQDLQRLYEDPALDVLLDRGDFGSAAAVVELGCGTGRLAEGLLRNRLSPRATYLGFDISDTMVELARRRLRPWADRADVRRSEGELVLPIADHGCDRFVSTYVLDLLDEDDIQTALDDARRVLAPGGKLCLASLTTGTTRWSRIVGRTWSAVHARRPMWVGGCRPLELAPMLGRQWRIVHREVVCRFGICTEVVIAT